MEAASGKLKYLGFVKKMIKTVILVLCWLWQYVKDNYCGNSNLRLALSTLENAIISVYANIKFVPRQILSFLDQKIDEHASPFVKKVLDRTNQIVEKASDIGDMLVKQIKLVGLQNAMAIIGTFIKNYLFSSLLPLLGSKLFQIPVLGSMTKMTFSPLSKLPGVPIPDLTKALDQTGVAPALKDGLNFSEDLTKAFKQVGVTPAENFIGDLTKKVGAIPQVVAKNDTTNIIKDTADTLKTVALAPIEKDAENIIQGFSNVFMQDGGSSSKTN